jgi:serine/threonine protein kinase
MPLKLKAYCPKCRATVAVNGSLVGKRVRCTSCKEVFQVSAVEAPRGAASLDQMPVALRTLTGSASETPRDPNSYPPQFSQAGIVKLGRYELKDVLGQGTFGRVYKAYDPQLERFVAVKVPLFDSVDLHRVQRFMAEGKAVARLHHPNIVPVFDAASDDGKLFLVSAFIEGETLAARMKRVPLEMTESVQLIKDLAIALAYAHEQGIVHRDVKPANIMLDTKGSPRLMDFGLAHIAESGHNLTFDGSVLGTPAYMAPEQAAGKVDQIGPASDQYSLAVVLYELLTGEPPFRGPVPVIIAQIINVTPVAPRSVNAEIPAQLGKVCVRALAKNPADRYPNCEAFAEALDRSLSSEHRSLTYPVISVGPKARSVNRKRRTLPSKLVDKRTIMVAAIMIAVVAGGVSYIAFQAPMRTVLKAPATPPPNTLSEQEMADGWQLLFDGKSLDGWVRSSPKYWGVRDGTIIARSAQDRLSNDNTFLIWEGSRPGDFELHVKYRISGGNAGIQYRSLVSNREQCIVKGYQADIDAGTEHSGAVWEEGSNRASNWRESVLAWRGQRVTIGSDGKRSMEAIGDSAMLQSVIKPNDWNEYRIIARRNHFQHYINGTLMAELIDNHRLLSEIASGVIALQFEPHTVAQVQFKDIRLKKLSEITNQSAASTAAGPTGLGFDGKSSCIRTNFRFDGSTALTIEAFALPGASFGTIVGDMQQAGCALGVDAQRWQFLFSNGGGPNFEWVQSDSLFRWGRKTHVAAVYDRPASRIYLYVDGIAQSKTGIADRRFQPADHWFMVGADPSPSNNAQHFFTGTIHSVRITKRAVYQASFSPPTVLDVLPDTVLLYRFDRDTGTTAVDLSGQGNNGTIENAQWIYSR